MAANPNPVSRAGWRVDPGIPLDVLGALESTYPPAHAADVLETSGHADRARDGDDRRSVTGASRCAPEARPHRRRIRAAYDLMPEVAARVSGLLPHMSHLDRRPAPVAEGLRERLGIVCARPSKKEAA